MLPSVIAVMVFQIAVNAILHIDRVIVDNNKKYNNITLDYWHDKTGNANVNLTVKTFEVATRMLVYLKVNVAEDVHDDLFKRELLRTQIDFSKLYDGIYGNVFIKGFIENFMQDAKNQNFSFPIKPVRFF